MCEPDRHQHIAERVTEVLETRYKLGKVGLSEGVGFPASLFEGDFSLDDVTFVTDEDGTPNIAVNGKVVA